MAKLVCDGIGNGSSVHVMVLKEKEGVVSAMIKVTYGVVQPGDGILLQIGEGLACIVSRIEGNMDEVYMGVCARMFLTGVTIRQMREARRNQPSVCPSMAAMSST